MLRLVRKTHSHKTSKKRKLCHTVMRSKRGIMTMKGKWKKKEVVVHSHVAGSESK